MKTPAHRNGFSLVELLVVITIIVMLVSMMGVAMNSARASGKKQQTKAAIAAIDAILQRHFASCESTPLNLSGTGDIGLSIRKKITADMPDRWGEVVSLKADLALPPASREFGSPRHRAYVATYEAIKSATGSYPSPQYDSSECLFMVVMYGGLADCLSCSSLDGVARGDKDSDGALEFWDAWGEPLGYILWPAGLQSPIDTPFFDPNVAPFDGGSPGQFVGGAMRPLVVSGGPNKNDTLNYKDAVVSYLGLGDSCGLPGSVSDLGGLKPDSDDMRFDNITNYDDAVKK